MKLTLDPAIIGNAPKEVVQTLAETIARAYAHDVPRLVHRIARLEDQVARHKRAMFEANGELEPVVVYVLAWGRDCDQYEFSDVFTFDNMADALAAEESFHRNAEGPQSWTYIDEEAYNAFVEQTGGHIRRDHAAEQMGY